MRIMKLSGIAARAVVIAVFVAMMAGCTHTASSPKTSELQKPQETKLITGIEVAQTSTSATVLIQGDQTLTYTAVKQPLPLGVVLYFPDAGISIAQAPAIPQGAIISEVDAVEITEKGRSVKLTVLLKKDLPYEVVRSATGLEIVIRDSDTAGLGQTASPSIASVGVMPANLMAVEAKPLENSVEIKVKSDQPLPRYDFFTVESPPRIVCDIYGVKGAEKAGEVISVDSKWVKAVRYFAYPDRLRLLIDTEIAFLNAYSASPVDDGLVIAVGASSVDMISKSPSPPQAFVPSSGKTAWMNRIDFASEADGKSTIIIGTTLPVEYEMSKVDSKRLELKLFNTGIQDFRRRPLITTRFESAVDRIIPVQNPSMKNYSIISIELREAAPYFVEQQDDLLFVHFEPSSVPPKPVDQASLAPWEKIVAETGTRGAAREEAVRVSDEDTADENVFEGKTRKFTGEKITLDFYETDIKNVFRILREVSGKNFAIDKDVTGKVTLTFEHPVPWDQVLDLVLKMNHLGMVHEGDIVRIATLVTLQKEQQLRQAKLEAEKKAREQEVAVEPLITEYIPINYSNAKVDIQPHLEKIKTADRGSISVDDRTNIIIMTDVAATIVQAKEIVKKLDRVTPQVIIEARIVEASDTFSREIGTAWDIATDKNSDTLGGNFGFDTDYGVNTGVNFPGNIPATSFGALGFNFTRIAGSQLVLNAAIAALEARGEGKLVSSPKIVTLDNKEASIKQGVEYPYLERDEAGLATLEWKEINLELKVTPHVTLDNRISMKIFIEKNDLGNIINNQQSFTTKGAETELLVDDGDTIVIGGIIKLTQHKDKSGVPGLMDIPIVGWLFKTQYKQDNKEELLIFITPKIVQLEQRMASSDILAR